MKEAIFSMKLEPKLHTEFMAEAEAARRSASQVVRELMHEFVQRQREARKYGEVLRRKVEAGRISMRRGMGRSDDEVEVEFAARRTSVVKVVWTPEECSLSVLSPCCLSIQAP